MKTPVTFALLLSFVCALAQGPETYETPVKGPIKSFTQQTVFEKKPHFHKNVKLKRVFNRQALETRLTFVSTANGNLITDKITTYNGAGKTMQVYYPWNGNMWACYNYYYNNTGQLTAIVTEMSKAFFSGYETYSYDSARRVTEKNVFNTDSALVSHTVFEYTDVTKEFRYIKYDSIAETVITTTDNRTNRTVECENLFNINIKTYDTTGMLVSDYNRAKLDFATQETGLDIFTYDSTGNALTRNLLTYHPNTGTGFPAQVVNVSYRYQYQYDHYGNWVRCVCFTNGKKQLVYKRQIEYYNE